MGGQWPLKAPLPIESQTLGGRANPPKVAPEALLGRCPGEQVHSPPILALKVAPFWFWGVAKEGGRKNGGALGRRPFINWKWLKRGLRLRAVKIRGSPVVPERREEIGRKNAFAIHLIFSRKLARRRWR